MSDILRKYAKSEKCRGEAVPGIQGIDCALEQPLEAEENTLDFIDFQTDLVQLVKNLGAVSQSHDREQPEAGDTVERFEH